MIYYKNKVYNLRFKVYLIFTFIETLKPIYQSFDLVHVLLWLLMRETYDS